MCAWSVVVRYGRSLAFSGIGKPSMSARNATRWQPEPACLGPVPMRSTTRPVTAHFLILESGIPKLCKASSSAYCVRTSLKPPSGCVCSARRIAIMLSVWPPALSMMVRWCLKFAVKSTLPDLVKTLIASGGVTVLTWSAFSIFWRF